MEMSNIIEPRSINSYVYYYFTFSWRHQPHPGGSGI